MSQMGKRVLTRKNSAPAKSQSALGSIESLEPRMLLAYSTTVDLQFNAATGGLNGTGFAAVLPTTKGKGFIPANVTMGNGQLRLLSTAGDLTNNNQDDALNIPINGAADFQVETRLTSFGFTKNYQYSGILLGTNEDNYLNLITGYVGQPVIEFTAENNKTFSIPLWKAINPAGITSVDLRLTGTAATKQVMAEYRINSDLATGWVALGSVAAPQVFNASAKAGVVATNTGSTTAVQTSFNWFTARHTPAVTPPPPPPPTSTYPTTVDLTFDAPTTGLNSTGFTAALPTSRGKGFIPANVTLGNGQLRLTSTAGDLTNNNQDNALNVPLNGAADFQVETRLTSFGFTKNYQYAGITLATGEDNYLNLVTGYIGQPVIEFTAESNKTFTIPLWKAINPAGIQSIDLRMTGTAATKEVKAEYRINSDPSAPWTTLGTVAAPQVFNASAKAGVVATNAGSTTAVQTSFNGFTVRHSPTTTPPPPPPPPPGQIPVTIGTNLEGIADYSTISPFIDLSTMFRQWGSVATPYIADPSIPMTADNYPLADAGTMTYARTYPDGDYQVSYAGQANLSFNGLNANFQVTSSINGITTGILHIEPISHPGNMFMYATGLNPANPLRDLHIISPDVNYAVSDTFRPVFLQKIAPFDGYLRMMDWMHTMSSPIVNWADRTKTTRFSYVTETGVPYEHIIKLANTAKKDLYINIPVQATDDYVHELAKMFRDQLAPDRKLYVEFANELWGYIGNLPDANISLAAAQQERLTDKTLWKTDAWGLSAQRVGKKLATFANIFKQEWGAAKYAAQARFQMGALIAASSWGDIALQYIQDNFGPPKDILSGLSVGNYVGVWTDFDPIDNDTLTLDRLFDWSRNFVTVQMSYWLKTNKITADKFGLQLNIYEGGQAFTYTNGKNEAIKRAAQNDPRMGDLYRQLITQFTQISQGGIWGSFALSSAVDKFGFWGILENITDAGSMKYNTVTGMVNATV